MFWPSFPWIRVARSYPPGPPPVLRTSQSAARRIERQYGPRSTVLPVLSSAISAMLVLLTSPGALGLSPNEPSWFCAASSQRRAASLVLLASVRLSSAAGVVGGVHGTGARSARRANVVRFAIGRAERTRGS